MCISIYISTLGTNLLFCVAIIMILVPWDKNGQLLKTKNNSLCLYRYRNITAVGVKREEKARLGILLVQASDVKAYGGLLHLQALSRINTRSVLWWPHAAGAAAALQASSPQSCQLCPRPRTPPGTQSPPHSSLRGGEWT